MSDRSWRFRTTEGTVTVGNDAVTVQSTPRAFLAGQLARWRGGTGEERAKSLLAVAWVVGGVGLTASNVSSLLDVGIVGAAGMSGLLIAFVVVPLWSSLLRETTIPRSALESVSIHEADRTLTIVHESTGRLDALSAWLWAQSTPLPDGRWKWTATLPTEADVEEARQSFRLRGISLDPPDSEIETETSYGFVTEDGVYFCEDCGSQVSPTDSDCPSCGHALRVEEVTGDGSVEHATD
jgi:hypothetical protein